MSIPAAYLGVIIIWSTTPLAIKWSSEAGGFLLGVSGRMVLGALVCVLIITLWRVDFPWHRAARRGYMVASLSIYGALTATYWGAQFIPSGIISVLFGIAPIVTSVLSILLLKERALRFSQWLGMLLGVIGLGLIFYTELQLNHNHVKGLFAILLAVLLHSFSAVWIKRMNLALSPLALTGGALLMVLPLYGTTWLLFGESVPETLSIRAISSIIYLGIMGSVVGFVLYYYLLKQIEAKQVALITLITPVTALFLGQNLNGELIPISAWLGAAVVLSGLALYQWRN